MKAIVNLILSIIIITAPLNIATAQESKSNEFIASAVKMVNMSNSYSNDQCISIDNNGKGDCAWNVSKSDDLYYKANIFD
ncbi:MAG: hypothetical protein HQK52_12805 [Oligoflexia bacterium]|nr:hypothetical protein [Oligoflexia bacterium]